MYYNNKDYMYIHICTYNHFMSRMFTLKDSNFFVPPPSLTPANHFIHQITYINTYTYSYIHIYIYKITSWAVCLHKRVRIISSPRPLLHQQITSFSKFSFSFFFVSKIVNDEINCVGRSETFLSNPTLKK
jgi:hypothetical protein